MDLSFQFHDVDDVHENTSPPLIKGIILLPMSYVTQSTNPKAYSNNKSKVMIISPTTAVPSIPENLAHQHLLTKALID